MISGELKYTAIKFGEAFAEAYELCQTFPAYRDEGAHTAEAISAFERLLCEHGIKFYQNLINALEAAPDKDRPGIFSDLRAAMDARVFDNDIILYGREWITARMVVNASGVESAVISLTNLLYAIMQGFEESDDTIDIIHLVNLLSAMQKYQAGAQRMFDITVREEFDRWDKANKENDPVLSGLTSILRRLEAGEVFEAADATESNSVNNNSAVTYKYDPRKVNTVHDFCIGDVFTGVEPHTFAECVASADFSKIFCAAETKKTKFKYIIYILSHVISDTGQTTNWYRAAAGSIGLTPQKCSSANVPDDWKSSANALK